MEGGAVSTSTSSSAGLENSNIDDQWDQELAGVEAKGEGLDNPKVRKVVENFIGNMTIEMIKQNMKPKQIQPDE